ncbi:MAG: hypothetical protein HFJ72_09180 [Adlercreutzia sp.]|nr:hypothetical protein [Adlercreutzia sp.]
MNPSKQNPLSSRSISAGDALMILSGLGFFASLVWSAFVTGKAMLFNIGVFEANAAYPLNAILIYLALAATVILSATVLVDMAYVEEKFSCVKYLSLLVIAFFALSVVITVIQCLVLAIRWLPQKGGQLLSCESLVQIGNNALAISAICAALVFAVSVAVYQYVKQMREKDETSKPVDLMIFEKGLLLAIAGIVVSLSLIAGVIASGLGGSHRTAACIDDETALYYIVLESADQYCVKRCAIENGRIEINDNSYLWVNKDGYIVEYQHLAVCFAKEDTSAPLHSGAWG